MRRGIDDMVSGLHRLEREAMLSAKREPRLSNAWFDAVKTSIGELDGAIARAGSVPQAAELLETLREVVDNAQAQIAGSVRLFAGLADLGDESDRLKSAVAEMTRLEERMKGIIESCGVLLRRIQPQEDPVPG